MVSNENAEEIIGCIKALPLIYRDTLYLFYVEELTSTQIAKKINRKKATVKKQLYRGKILLLELLNKKGIHK